MGELTAAEQAAAKANWALMDEDMRAFVVALVKAGLMDGRAGLAQCRVAVLPDHLPESGGVVPCIETAAERQAKAKSRKALW